MSINFGSPPYLSKRSRHLEDSEADISIGNIEEETRMKNPYIIQNGLMIVKPHHFTYKTFVKGRWNGKTVLEVFQKEFRDRTKYYYDEAVRRGQILLNGNPCSTSTLLSMNDVIEHRIHRHEPVVPYTGPIRWSSAQTSFMEDMSSKEPYDDNTNMHQVIIVDKPSGIPVHPTGRYFHNTITEILKHQEGFSHLSNINRLDRPTSGLLIVATNNHIANKLHKLMENRSIQKEYIAMVNGKFPISMDTEQDVNLDNVNVTLEDGWICCTYPILVVSHKLGLCTISDTGKRCKTFFKLLKTFEIDDASGGRRIVSIVHCRPFTGRTHQIRVHLQHLGFPIVNDMLYGDPIWTEMKDKRSGTPNSTYLSEDDLYEVAQRLLDRLLPESFHSDMQELKQKFCESMTGRDDVSFPDWFDEECEECQRQWLRTHDNPDTPLVIPMDGSERSARGIMLHAFKYYTDEWEFHVPWPDWANK